MGKLPTLSGGIMMTLMNISGQLIKFATIFLLLWNILLSRNSVRML